MKNTSKKLHIIAIAGIASGLGLGSLLAYLTTLNHVEVSGSKDDTNRNLRFTRLDQDSKDRGAPLTPKATSATEIPDDDAPAGYRRDKDGALIAETEQAKLDLINDLLSNLETPTGRPHFITKLGDMRYSDFEERPFNTISATENFLLTGVEALDPDVSQHIATNDLHADGLKLEAEYLKSRQVVYGKDLSRNPVNLMESAFKEGTNIESLVAPGLDGREHTLLVLEQEITKNGKSGIFTGTVEGFEESSFILSAEGAGPEEKGIPGNSAFSVNLQMTDSEGNYTELIIQNIGQNSYQIDSSDPEKRGHGCQGALDIYAEDNLGSPVGDDYARVR